MDGFSFFDPSTWSTQSSFPGDTGGGSPDLTNVVAPPPTLPDPSTYGGYSFGGTPDLSGSQSFSNPLSVPSTPGIMTQPNFAGGAASPGFGGTAPQTGAYADFLNGTSAMSNPGAPNIGQGPTSASAPGAPPPAGGDNSLLDLLTGGHLSTGSGKLDQNILGGLVSGGGLLANLMMGSPSASAEKSLKNIAGTQNAQGQQLERYLANGTLPPGAQQWVGQQTQAQKAAIRSKYAQLGMSGSTSEMQELNNVDAQATSQMFTIASQLLNTGISETNASGTLYNYLMQAQNADAKDVSAAIQNFVSSLGGGGSGGQSITLKAA